MKSKIKSLFIFTFFFLLCRQAASAANTDTSLLILKNVNVLDVNTGKYLKGRNVAISQGRILSIDAGKKIWKNAKVVDLSGKYLIPGLIDGHVHVSAHKKNNMENTYSHLNYYLRHGVTSVRDASGDGASLLAAQRAINNGERRGASVYFAALMAGDWYFNRDLNLRKDPYLPWEQLVTEKTNLDSAMRVAKACGATGVKLYHSFDKVLLPKVVASAKAQGLKTWGHVMMYPANPIDVASSGVEVLSHVFMLENLVTDTLFLKRKTPISYKDSVINNFDVKPFCDIMKANNSILDATLCVSEERDPWIFTLLKKIYKEGVAISAGTDQIVDLKRPYPRLLDELESFVEKCGFSPIDALRSATIVSSRVIGQEKNIGTIENGKVADLLVLNGDPLIDMRKLRDINMVIKFGKIVDIK
ncbi:amidohydrolase family protein [Pedobacter sp. MC2016-14]|uniref:amidohydrolase family protein n=1 Tax=Pedobacter sp. MC2016-14 TaxID=2897327 RepID=UPI001E370B7D|nr:amidohydrolase family protein [Pedobacter sp. MC2016-14]MCD0488099.1 amidohydrolase family protein [Pedobacter sp. MC2016-14]